LQRIRENDLDVNLQILINGQPFDYTTIDCLTREEDSELTERIEEAWQEAYDLVHEKISEAFEYLELEEPDEDDEDEDFEDDEVTPLEEAMETRKRLLAELAAVDTEIEALVSTYADAEIDATVATLTDTE